MIKFQKLDDEHSVLTNTAEQKANLRQLAEYLLALPEDYEHFSMTTYFELDNDNVFIGENQFVEKIQSCGSVACAIGHGPLAGIKESKEDCCWSAYARRVFGYSDGGTGTYLFGFEWSYSAYDTAKDAGHRILYVLEHGFPDHYYSLSLIQPTVLEHV